MMTSASVALQAPLAPEPMLEALRSLVPRAEPDRAPERSEPHVQASTVTYSALVTDAEPAAVVATQPVTWVEPQENLWLLSVKNFGLTLATFGIYHFWGRAEMTRQTVNAIHVDGKPLDYTGSGREAFISFALGAVIAVSIVSAFLYLMLSNTGGAGGIEGLRQIRWQRLTISLPLLFLLGSIAYRRRQHILRRTWLNGQRFDLNGHPWSYAWRHFWSAFTVPLTLGWAAPWRMSTLEQRKVSEMHYGAIQFRPAGDLKGLYRAFAVLWFGGGLLYVATLVVLSTYIGPQLLAAINGLTLEPLKTWAVIKPALGVLSVAALPLATIGLIYRKAWYEHQVSSMATAEGRLRLKLPMLPYLAHSFGGFALAVMSLGCFHPVAKARFTRFMVQHVTVEGRLGLVPQTAA
jgi:uncharacterized membrane protein YjgN (DUF898 family)